MCVCGYSYKDVDKGVDDDPLGLGPSPEFVCVSCGNKKDECHQYVYGSWLVQQTISYMNEKEMDEISMDDVKHNMKYCYNQQVNFDCYKENGMFDSNCWYPFPECLEKGGVKFALKLARNKQIFYHLKKRREGGVVGRMMLNRATKVYDYSDVLNMK